MLRVPSRLLALAFLSAIVLAGCGKEEGSPPAPGEKPSAPAKKEARPPKGAIVVKIGVVVPKTGPIESYGDMVEKGVLLAADDAKAEGKVFPELVIVDNGADLQKTTTTMSKFIDTDKVSAIIGPVTSKNAIAAGDRAEAGEVPLVTPTATNVQVTQNRKYVFRVCFTDDFQGQAAANFCFDTLGARRAAILMDSGETYSIGLGEVFGNAFKQRGGEIVSQVSFASQADDFGGQVTQLKLKKPDVIFMPTYYEPAAKCVSQARAAGLRTTFVGTDGWDSPSLYTLSGGAARGNYFTTHFSPLENRDVVKRFVQNFRAAYDKDPDALAALGYDAALVVFDAVKRAGSADRQAITKALAATRDFEAVTGKFSIDDKHNAVKGLVILETGDRGSTIKAVVKPQ